MVRKSTIEDDGIETRPAPAPPETIRPSGRHFTVAILPFQAPHASQFL
jgi:hypothetical protein